MRGASFLYVDIFSSDLGEGGSRSDPGMMSLYFRESEVFQKTKSDKFGFKTYQCEVDLSVVEGDSSDLRVGTCRLQIFQPTSCTNA